MTANQASTAKTRFFVALIPPPEVHAEATQLKEYFRDRYNSQAALRSPPHITLQAPFEWPAEHGERVIRALTEFRCSVPVIPIRLSGFGAFPPRVIYLDVEHTSALMTLQTELSVYLAETLQVMDPRSRDRPFRPHLTVAFRDLKPVAFRQAWPEFQHRAVHFSFELSTFALLRHLGKQWLIYKTFDLQ